MFRETAGRHRFNSSIRLLSVVVVLPLELRGQTHRWVKFCVFSCFTAITHVHWHCSLPFSQMSTDSRGELFRECRLCRYNVTIGALAEHDHIQTDTESGKSIYKLLAEVPDDVTSGAKRITAPDDCHGGVSVVSLFQKISQGRRMKEVTNC